MDQEFFVSNRRHLAAEYSRGGLFVISAYAQMQRRDDSAFAFEQEANFWWLTGIDAPDWWLIYDGNRDHSWLVAPHLSATHQLFEGGLSADDAASTSGIRDVIDREEAGTILRRLARTHSIVYALGDDPYARHYDFTLNPAGKEMWQRLSRIFDSIQDCRPSLNQLRAIKQPAEIKVMEQAIGLTVDTFDLVKSNLNSYKFEYEVEAQFSYEFRRHGAAGHAYDPIVAAGGNACTLHYVANSSRLKKRELLLIDIGARWRGYAADITRTYALGEPTKRQREVHEALQHAQAEIIALIRPELPVEEYQRGVDAIMKRALLGLGLMQHEGDDENYRKYFPHAISHGLGLDVHDSLGAPKYLQAGMVLTVEPGIYIPAENLGVRIEDDIVVTESGNRNLSRRLSTDW